MLQDLISLNILFFHIFEENSRIDKNQNNFHFMFIRLFGVFNSLVCLVAMYIEIYVCE